MKVIDRKQPILALSEIVQAEHFKSIFLLSTCFLKRGINRGSEMLSSLQGAFFKKQQVCSSNLIISPKTQNLLERNYTTLKLGFY